MNVQETSQLAFDSIKPTLGARQRLVYDALAKTPSTNLELAYRLHIPINEVTPRTRELVLRGLVHERRKRICTQGGRRAIEWEIVRDTLF